MVTVRADLQLVVSRRKRNNVSGQRITGVLQDLHAPSCHSIPVVPSVSQSQREEHLEHCPPQDLGRRIYVISCTFADMIRPLLWKTKIVPRRQLMSASRRSLR